MDPYYHRSTSGSASGYSSSSYRLQPQYSLPREPLGLDRWSSLPSADPRAFSSYPRSALDPRLDRLASFPRETLPPRGYGRPLQDFRPRGRFGGARPARKKPVPAESLGPKKKAFKQTQGGKQTKAAKPAADAAVVKKEAQKESQKKKDMSLAEAQAKEAKELHILWRTGVDVNPTKKQKVEKEEGGTEGKKEGDKPSYNGKKGKRKRKLPKKKKWSKKASEDGGEAASKIPRWGDEKEAVIDMQREAGKNARESLGISPIFEATESKPTPEATADGDAEPKSEEKEEEKEEEKVEEMVPELTPEEAKAIEEKAVEYFSKVLVENKALRRFYLERANFGTFECPVCAAINYKFVKRFRSLVSLITHASKVLKPKCLCEHRGFARAVCTLMKWDPLKLPPFPKTKAIIPLPDDEKDPEEKDVQVGDADADTKAEKGDDIVVPDKDAEEVTEQIEADEKEEKPEEDSSVNEAKEDA